MNLVGFCIESQLAVDLMIFVIKLPEVQAEMIVFVRNQDELRLMFGMLCTEKNGMLNPLRTHFARKIWSLTFSSLSLEANFPIFKCVAMYSRVLRCIGLFTSDERSFPMLFISKSFVAKLSDLKW